MDLHSMSTVLGLELRLLIWITIGSFAGFMVELSTSKNAKGSSILFHAKLNYVSRGVRFSIFVLNILVGSLFAYALTPLVVEYMHIKPTWVNSTGFLLGVASLPLVRGYSIAMKNKQKVSQFIFNVIDLIRGAK